MIIGPIVTEVSSLGVRQLPFRFQPGDKIPLDLTYHRYKVIYSPTDVNNEIRKRDFTLFASYEMAMREIRGNFGARLEILGDDVSL